MMMSITRQQYNTNYSFSNTRRLNNTNYTDTVITTVTASGSIVAMWLLRYCNERHLHHGIVSFSIKHRSPDQRCLHHGIASFNSKHRSTYRRVVTVIQLGLADRCLLFQLRRAPYIPQSLRNFLANPSFMFVGFGIYEEAMRLYEDCGLVVHNMTDLGVLAAESMGQVHPIGLQDLAFEEMNFEWIKPPMVETSAYSRRVLTDDEVTYASIESIISADLGRSSCLDSSYQIKDWGWVFFPID